jgi:hypothetical protein
MATREDSGSIVLTIYQIVRHCHCQSELSFGLHNVWNTHEPNSALIPGLWNAET